MESLEPVVGEGATLFMAPELLYPSRFGLEKCVPTKEADIYAIAMVVYQVGTARFTVRTRVDFHHAGPHWSTAVQWILRARGRFQGLGRRKTFETGECIRTWSL